MGRVAIDSKIKITVSKEIQEYLIPLNDEEIRHLEKNLLSEGCRDPLIVWPNKGHLVLIDGHNRFRICNKHGLEYKIKKVNFSDIDHAKVWMIENQIGRRNLNSDQLSYYRGLRYISIKKKKGGYQMVEQKGIHERSSSYLLGNQFSVSESTIKRDSKFAQGLNIL